MKKNNIIPYLIITLFVLISCHKDKPVRHRFTDDELKWIYFKHDTLDYLVNNTDTVRIHISTIHNSIDHDPDIDCDNGNAVVNVHDFVDFIIAANIDISKCGATSSDVNYDSEVVNEIYVSDKYHLGVHFHINEATKDTATVNGTFYNEVYKFQRNPVDSDELKTVIIAKGYGFLKIELKDGRKIELINN